MNAPPTLHPPPRRSRPTPTTSAPRCRTARADFTLLDARSPPPTPPPTCRARSASRTARSRRETLPDGPLVVYCWGPGCNAATKAAREDQRPRPRGQGDARRLRVLRARGLPRRGRAGATVTTRTRVASSVLPGETMVGCSLPSERSQRPPRRLWRRPPEHGDARGARRVGARRADRRRALGPVRKPLVVAAAPPVRGLVAGALEWPLADRGRWVLGRGSHCDLVLADDDAVSRAHAEIAVRAGLCLIRDLDSCNGTLLNGRFVPPRAAPSRRRADARRDGDPRPLVVQEVAELSQTRLVRLQGVAARSRGESKSSGEARHSRLT